jgi:predicted component of type VI protein secretion system
MRQSGGREMEKNTKRTLLLILTSLFLLCSCAPPVVIPPKWEYEKDAIRLNLKTDPQLHLVKGVPHTLALCVYFLENPNDFNQLLDEKGGLEKLCECSKFAPSVTNSRRLIIHPNKEYKEWLDRPTAAKYVTIVAGYYHLQKENIYRLFRIPVVEEKKGTFRKTVTQKPGVMNIDLYFGTQKIEDMVRGKEK